MMWPSFWYNFCATLPLEMRTVGLVLFLLSVLYCLPAGRAADQVFSPAVRPNCPTDMERKPPLPPPTPTPSHRRCTRQDLLDIGAAFSSSAGPLSPLLIARLRHLDLACNQPRKPRRSRRGGRNNNNNVHLSCAYQRPERSHNTY